MKKKIFVIVIASVILIPLLLIVASRVTVMLKNNIIAEYFLEELEYPRPDSTQIYEKYSKIGLLVGNGNHCDFFSGIIFYSQLSREEIKKFYQERQSYAGELLFLDNSTSIEALLPDHHIESIRRMIRNDLSGKINGKGEYFLIYSLISRPYNGDLRCF